MKIGILGSGMVGQVIGAKLIELGHEVMIGTRDPGKLDDKKGWAGSLGAWLNQAGAKGKVGTFAQAAAFGETVVNASNYAAHSHSSRSTF